MGSRVRACNSIKIWNWSEFITSAKNSNTYCACCVDWYRHKPLLPSMWPGALFLVWFNNFDRTTRVTCSYSSRPFLCALVGFYWSYTLLLKPPILMRSWLEIETLRRMKLIEPCYQQEQFRERCCTKWLVCHNIVMVTWVVGSSVILSCRVLFYAGWSNACNRGEMSA